MYALIDECAYGSTDWVVRAAQLSLPAQVHLMSQAGLCHTKADFKLRNWLVSSLQCPNTRGASEIWNATGCRYASARKHNHFVALR